MVQNLPLFNDALKGTDTLKATTYEGYSVCPSGRVYSHRTNQWLKTVHCKKKGYGRIHITIKPNLIKNLLVHRLVAIAFIPNPDPDHKPQVNHIDGDKTNNNVTNLEWCTGKENMQHAHSIGLFNNKTLGEDNPRSKLTSEQVLAIRASSDSSRVEAAKYGVNHSTITAIRKRIKWKHL